MKLARSLAWGQWCAWGRRWATPFFTIFPSDGTCGGPLGSFRGKTTLFSAQNKSSKKCSPTSVLDFLKCNYIRVDSRLDSSEGGSKGRPQKQRMDKNKIIIPVLVGTFLWNVCHDGPTAHPHTIESNYPTPTVCLVSAPVTGSYTTSSLTLPHTGDWTGR